MAKKKSSKKIGKGKKLPAMKSLRRIATFG